MKKNTLLLSFAMMSSYFAFSQNSRNCGTMEHLEFLKAQDKTIEAKMNEIENHTADYVQNINSTKTSGVITIPVVVHVLYNTSTQNISDAQIKSQIDVLNEDFRRLNADRTNLPSAFSSIAADAEINFCLASKAPNGSATTGIIRKSTTVSSFSSNNGVKYNSQGGSDAWNTSQYLNIWVCNLSGGLLGYAQFPGGPAATDGVVILYSAFGRTGTLSAPYNKGRTTTHEVGHWLNLRHIWGDASCGNDYVNDTPTQQTSNYGCPSYPHVTCSNGSAGDMFMNYMDYTDDGCMNTFTLGQKNRMNALFASGGARVGLTTSSGCSSTNTTTTTTTTASSSTVTIGKGTGTTITPYGTYYMDNKVQYIVTKAELVAGGYSSTSNVIKSLAFNVASNSTQVMNNFTIKIKHITASSFSSTSFISNSGMTTVYSANTAVTATGWKTHNFTTPFTYNGTDNLLIEICFDNNSYTTDSKVYYTATSTYNTLYLRSDVSAGGICANTTGTRSYNRPNMKLTLSSAANAFIMNDPEPNVYETSLNLRTLPKNEVIGFSLSPNPASQNININYNVDTENSNVNIVIYNMMGEILGEFKPQHIEEGQNNFNIDLNSDLKTDVLSSGVYFCKLIINDNVQTQKFVVSK